MAIDTAVKRNAALLDFVIVPDGTIDSTDRANLLAEYPVPAESGSEEETASLVSTFIEVYDPADTTGVPKATLDPSQTSRVWNPKFRHPYKGIGSGSFNLQNDDADIGNVAEGDLIRHIKDTKPVFEWQVKSKNRVSVDKAGGIGVPSGLKFTEVAGLGTKGYGARSPIRPWRGGIAQPKEIMRAFDWRSPHFEASGYDLTGWEFAAAFARVDSLTSAHWIGSPAAVPDNQIYWVGSGSIGSDDDAPEGVQLVRFPPFELTEDKLGGFFAFCDNEGILSLNGTDILTIDSFEVVRYIDLQLTAGAYFPSIFLRNATPTATSATNNPAGCGLGIYERTAQGLFVARIYVSNVDAQVLPLPTITPGMPIGYTLRKLLDEAQARGEMPGVTPGFTNSISTNGETFPATDIGAVVGQSFTDYLLALEDAVVDIEMAPGLTLNVYYPKGSHAIASSATFTDGVSLRKLTHQEQDDRITGLFIDYDGGYVDVGEGPFVKPLKFQQVASEDAAMRIGTGILAGRDVSALRYIADIVTGPGREPYEDFGPGDTVPVDDPSAALADVPVAALTWTINKAGRSVWAGEFGDLIEPFETVADRAVKRFAATRSATNIHTGELLIKGGGGQIYKPEIIPFTYEESDLQISQKRNTPVTRNLGFLTIQLDEPDTEDHTFIVRVNGTEVADLTTTIPAGDDYARTWTNFPGDVVTAGTDKITLEFTGLAIRFDADLGLR